MGSPYLSPAQDELRGRNRGYNLTIVVSRRGEEDTKQHWFLRGAIWSARGTNNVVILVEFLTTLCGRALQW